MLNVSTPNFLCMQKGNDGDEEAPAAKPAPLAETVQCLVAAWQHSTLPSILAHGTSVADALLLALSPGPLLPPSLILLKFEAV